MKMYYYHLLKPVRKVLKQLGISPNGHSN